VITVLGFPFGLRVIAIRAFVFGKSEDRAGGFFGVTYLPIVFGGLGVISLFGMSARQAVVKSEATHHAGRRIDGSLPAVACGLGMISFVAVGTFGAVVIGVASDVAGWGINGRLKAMLKRICEVLVLRMTATCASEFGISRR
jgi:hypothetical protein